MGRYEALLSLLTEEQRGLAVIVASHLLMQGEEERGRNKLLPGHSINQGYPINKEEEEHGNVVSHIA